MKMGEFLIHSRRLINDVKMFDRDEIETVVPHIIRGAIILFSAEVEHNLKDFIAIALKHISLKNKSLNELREFLKKYTNKSRNPKFEDIKELLSFFGINITLNNPEINYYNNIITQRNRMAHDPRAIITTSLEDIEQAIEIAEKLLSLIKDEIKNKILEEVEREFER